MALSGSGLLAIWNDIDPAAEAEFAAWHVREHIPERVGLPGFLVGRRYIAVDAQPRYFNFYEAADAGVFESEVYLARLNDPTPWTRAVVAHFRNTSRTICDVVGTRGRGMGAFVLTVQLPAQAGVTADGALLDRLMEQPGVAGAHLLAGHVHAAVRATAETKLRDGADERIGGLLLVEGVDAQALQALAAGEVLTAALADAPDARHGLYRLQYVLTQADLRRA